MPKDINLNSGKDSEDIFEKVFESLGAFVDRQSDMLDAAKQKKVATRKSSDFLVTYNGQTWYVEVKSIATDNRFKFSSIQPAQWRAATRVVAAQGHYYFYLHFMAQNLWFKVPAKVILNSEKKSLTIDEVSNYRVYLEAEAA